MCGYLDVSIIIVNYNTKNLTRNCLLSVFQQTKDIQFEVIVSDNGSTDGSIEMIKADFPQVVLIENNANLGFGAANNCGLKIARGKYIFYLNSDTVLLNNAVKIFFDYWEDAMHPAEIGALGCILQDQNGYAIHSGGEFPTISSILDANMHILKIHKRNSLIKKWHLNWLYQLFSNMKAGFQKEIVKAGNVDYITGADLFLKNNEYAYFDESFFLYYEETDLELRLAEKNLARILIDTPKIIHLTRKQNPKLDITSFSMLHIQISSVRYLVKNLKGSPDRILNIIQEDWQNPFVRAVINKYPSVDFEKLLMKAAAVLVC